MKTQIIRRTILAATIIFIGCANCNGSTQTNRYSVNTILKTREDAVVLSGTTNTHKNTACITCKFYEHTNTAPVIPEPNGDHEFHSFHIKDKNAKHMNFWKNIANKVIEAIYYLIVLIFYMPFKHN